MMTDYALLRVIVHETDYAMLSVTLHDDRLCHVECDST